jgi:hypothetical protein
MFEAIAFKQGPRIQELAQNRYVDFVYVLEQNEWQGVRNLQLRILDFRPAS